MHWLSNEEGQKKNGSVFKEEAAFGKHVTKVSASTTHGASWSAVCWETDVLRDGKPARLLQINEAKYLPVEDRRGECGK